MYRVEYKPAQKAEGLCMDIPYATEIVSIDGVNVHLWAKHSDIVPKLREALAQIKRERDVVSCTWCLGEPAGFY